VDKAATQQVLMVGCSDQSPNDVRAYHLVDVSPLGVRLSGHDGRSYTAAAGDISPYNEMLTSLLALVLDGMPAELRGRARGSLIKRWNRNWGVMTEPGLCSICAAEDARMNQTPGQPSSARSSSSTACV
jgi:hypothetical protein